MDTTAIELSVTRLGESSTADDLLEVGNLIQRVGEFHRQVKAAWEQKMIEHINRCGPVECGDVRYYVGVDRETKCADPAATTQACLEASQGDLSAFVGVLASGAFRHGACRKLLPPDVFDTLFVTTEKPDLKTGKPERKLQRADQRFIGK